MSSFKKSTFKLTTSEKMAYFDGGINGRSRYGGGLSNVFSSAIRKMSPLVKEVASTGKKIMKTQAAKTLLDEAGKAALDASLQIADKTLAGENIVSAARQNAKSFGKHMLDKTNSMLDDHLADRQITRKQNRKRKPQENTSPKKKYKREKLSKRAGKIIHRGDIFDEQDNSSENQ